MGFVQAYRWRGFKPRQQWYKSEFLLTLNQFELMRSLFHTDESAVDCHVAEPAFPIPATTRFITEKQWIAFPIAEIPLDSVANVDEFAINIAVDVSIKITDDNVRWFPRLNLTERELTTHGIRAGPRCTDSHGKTTAILSKGKVAMGNIV